MVFSPPRGSCSRHSHTPQKQVCEAFYHPNSKSMNLLEYLGLAETCELQSSIAMQSLLPWCINPTQPQVHHQRLQSKPWSSTGPEKRCRKNTCKLLPIPAHHSSAPGSSSRAARNPTLSAPVIFILRQENKQCWMFVGTDHGTMLSTFLSEKLRANGYGVSRATKQIWCWNWTIQGMQKLWNDINILAILSSFWRRLQTDWPSNRIYRLFMRIMDIQIQNND